ncbi:MAG: hypothetical protein O3C10_09330 [Chloroflexi bacterium]|nr:hypothetical protein [Chloroflexota bacterium]
MKRTKLGGSTLALVLIATLSVASFDISALDSIAVVVSIYVMGEITQRTFSVVVLDDLRGHRGVANIQRTLILGIINFFEMLAGFAVLYAVWIPDGAGRVVDMKSSAARVPDMMWLSIKTATFISVPEDMEGYEWLIPASQILMSLWLIAILIGWAIDGLPKRSG